MKPNHAILALTALALTLASISYTSVFSADGHSKSTRTLPNSVKPSGDCKAPPLNLGDTVSPSTWTSAADDFVVGRVSGIKAVWVPMANRNGIVDSADCERGIPALQVILEDVESLLGNTPSKSMQITLGSGTWNAWGLSHSISTKDDGSIQWPAEGPEISAGMLIGGALYYHPISGLPTFLTGAGEPLFEVVDGKIWFQEAIDGECSLPSPETKSLDGLTISELRTKLSDTAPSRNNQDVSAYRDWMHVASDTYSRSWSFSYAAFCYHDTQQGEPPASAFAECKSDADCDEGFVCLESEKICIHGQR